MKIRQQVYDQYWHFAAERQAIFFRKLLNQPQPWSADPILSSFKFCNTYRASDRVSQYLIKNVIYAEQMTDEDTLFRIVLFKLFNRVETWEWLNARHGPITLRSFDPARYADSLSQATLSGQPIYTSAYMSCASKAFGYDKKHENHLALLDKMFCQDRLAVKIAKSASMHDVFSLLVDYPLIGPFMAYQLATDMNYSEAIDFSEQSFTVIGPGSERGIRKCFENTNGKGGDYIIRWMCDHQEQEFARLGINFQNLWGRPLQLIDCQGLFCETDKYSRAAFPDLKSNRVRIKARFQQTEKPIDFFYPPKWGINDKVQNTLRQRLT